MSLNARKALTTIKYCTLAILASTLAPLALPKQTVLNASTDYRFLSFSLLLLLTLILFNFSYKAENATQLVLKAITAIEAFVYVVILVAILAADQDTISALIAHLGGNWLLENADPIVPKASTKLCLDVKSAIIRAETVQVYYNLFSYVITYDTYKRKSNLMNFIGVIFRDHYMDLLNAISYFLNF